MSVRTAVPASFCLQGDSSRTGYKFLYTDFETIQARLTSNCGEFAIIKIGIVHTFPHAKKFHSIAIAKPIHHKEKLRGLQNMPKGRSRVVSADGGSGKGYAKKGWRVMEHG